MRRSFLTSAGKLLVVAAAACPLVAMTQDHPMSAKVSVIGVYSPSANKAEYEAFMAREVAARNPINFSDETKALLVRLRRAAEIVALTTEELTEIREDLERALSGAVLVEVLVSNPDGSFSIDKFQQAHPDLPKDRWQAAWCEKFLSADGTSELGKRKFDRLPTDQPYRVAFYIHDWKQEHGLSGPYGPLQLPLPEPMPARLWRLAPYQQVD